MKQEEENGVKKRVPLSLEELLAKKKAEEAALSKVCVEHWLSFSGVGFRNKRILLFRYIVRFISTLCSVLNPTTLLERLFALI